MKRIIITTLILVAIILIGMNYTLELDVYSVDSRITKHSDRIGTLTHLMQNCVPITAYEYVEISREEFDKRDPEDKDYSVKVIGERGDGTYIYHHKEVEAKLVVCADLMITKK